MATSRSSLAAPLANSVFLAIWIVTIVSNIGGWVQDIGAAWLMTSLSPSPLMVSLVQAASSLPVFLFSIPAGALADVVDRRRLLLFMQAWMLVAALVLGILTAQGWTTAISLIVMTFLLESGDACSGPAWQAVVPELVPREQLRDAITVSSLGINIARVVGPALGGVLVAAAGPANAFLINAASFLGVGVVLARWRRRAERNPLPVERFVGAVRAGVRYVRHSRPVRVVLLRTAAFMIAASSIWALLPSLARGPLGLGPGGYGALLGCMGAGALSTAFLLDRLRRRHSANRLVTGASALLAAAILVIAQVHSPLAVGAALLAAGAAWIAVASNLNAATQSATPDWVRARVMAVYLVVFFGAMAGGSVLWGAIAERFGLPLALSIASLVLVVGLPLALSFRLPSNDGEDMAPSLHWDAPVVVREPGSEEGPVLVTVTYAISADNDAAFLTAMEELREERLRGGAFAWGLYRDTAHHERIVETFLVESWAEHLRQHGRTTRFDRTVEEQARRHHVGPKPPAIAHLVYTRRSRDGQDAEGRRKEHE
jgi:MFS family permease